MTNHSKQKTKANKLDLTDSINLIESLGKDKMGGHFFIPPEDYEIIFKLLIWMIQDKKQCNKHNISIDKGILLVGPIGCGKTSLMRLMSIMVPAKRSFLVKPTRKIALEFSNSGYQVIEKYSSNDKLALCLDDLGVEPPIKYFGLQVHVIREILLSRYDQFITRGILTHATTNLSAAELEYIYGPRVRSRLREMFNLITFHPDTKDKRH